MGLVWQSSEPSEPKPQPQRPFSFSLKHVFIFLTAICILLGLYSAMGLLLPVGVLPIVAIGLVIHGWHSRNPSAFAWGIAYGGLSLFLGCMLPAVQFGSSSASGFYSCQFHIELVGQAVQLHSVERARLPARNGYLADGTPALSWRASILPFLDERPLYESMRFDEMWNSPHNSSFINESPRIYHCREAGYTPSETNYFAVGGPDTCWPDHGAISLEEIDDGTSHTVLLAESHGQNVTWSEPKDLDAASMNWQINAPNGPAISSPHQEQRKTFYVEDVMGWRPTGANVVMADGSVRFLPKNTDPEVVKQLLNRRDGQPR